MATSPALQHTPTALRSRPEGEPYAPLPDRKEHGYVTAHAVQTVLADPNTLFTLWSDLASIPLWQERVISVTPLGGNRSHWVMGDTDEPAHDSKAKQIEFDSEITESIPGRKIAWQSLDSDRNTSGAAADHPRDAGGKDDLFQRGEVHFAPGRIEGSTLVTLIQTAKVPGGALGNALATAGARGPKQLIIENLRHFKEFAETGEIPSVKDQPHGPRGVTGGFKRWLYGETNPTPPGTSEPTTPAADEKHSVSKP